MGRKIHRSYSLLVLLVAVSSLSATKAHAGGDELRVYSQNVYSGLDPSPILEATSPVQFLVAWGDIYDRAKRTRYNERAEAIAGEIFKRNPHVIALQEVGLWRSQIPSDGPITNATAVDFSFLQELKDALQALGLDYKVIATHTTLDFEMPAITSVGLADIRYTERLVVLGVNDPDFEFTNIKKKRFRNKFTIPVPVIGDIKFRRSWISVVIKHAGKRTQLINTHLEALSQSVRSKQAKELINRAVRSDIPVILVGDFNSDPRLPGSSAYDQIIADGFDDAWELTQPGANGFTCCQKPRLRNTNSKLSIRIDFIFVRDLLSVDLTRRFGFKKSHKTPSGRWPSDHAGLFAVLTR